MIYTFEKQLPFVRCQIRRAATTRDPLLVHRRDDFIEREIRSPTDQRKQKRRVRFQRRDASVARLESDASGRLRALHQFDCRTGTHLEPIGRLAPRRTRFNCVHNSLA